MNTQSVLDQLLKGGLGQVLGGMAGQRGGGMGQKPGVDLARLGGQAAAIGVLNMLLRRRGAALGGSSALKLGGLAALGMVAYKAWQDYQAKQPAGSTSGPAPSATPIEQLPAPQAEDRSRALLVAMIAAAKADGHVDAQERAALESELGRGQGEGEALDAALRGWLEAEIRKPLDPAEVARAAATPEAASEMYLASLLVAMGGEGGQISFMERSYLDELARQLQLPDGLKASLQAQAEKLG